MRYACALMATILTVLVGQADAQVPALPLVTEEFMVDSGDPGIQLYVRNKHPADMTQVSTEHILLYVHGSTQPSESTFDLVLDGISWMEYIAARGWDVYLMDARGYGGSTRSPEFARPDAIKAPIVSTDTKVRDAEAVINFILKRRGAAAINLLGWSFGTIVIATYAADHPDKVKSLVLFGPVWCAASCKFEPRSAESASDAERPKMGPIAQSPMADARGRLQLGVPFGRREELLPPDWFALWWDAALKTDPVGAKMTQPAVRAPGGAEQHFVDYWSKGQAYYDPKKITAPTLIVIGEMDMVTPRSGARALHASLENSVGRWLVELNDGSHVMMLERNRMSLFQAVQQFLGAIGAQQ
jgi:pimeloyl-ACP methyl ester carboxylesterase